MTKTLPWVKNPAQKKAKLGNDDTGILEIPIRLGLTVNETTFLEEKLEEFEVGDRMEKAIMLASDLMKKLKIDFKTAYAAIESGNIGVLGEGGSKELLELSKAGETASKKELAIKSTIMIRRILPEWDLTDTEDQILLGLQQWLGAFCDAESQAIAFNIKDFVEKQKDSSGSTMTEAKAKKS